MKLKYIKVEDFTEAYSKAFISYMAYRNSGKDTARHPVDVAIEMAGFAEAFYHAVDAIHEMDK